MIQNSEVPLPRRFAVVDIKLLRLGLVAKDLSICQGISTEWAPAQPSENLSPFLAAQHLCLSKNEVARPWMPSSEVQKKYRNMQMRFPPEQFSQKHLDWQPAAELLASPTARLNWYWQSGQIPGSEIFDHLPETKIADLEALVTGSLSILSNALHSFFQ